LIVIVASGMGSFLLQGVGAILADCVHPVFVVAHNWMDVPEMRSYGARMARRHSGYNPLEITRAPRWLVVRSMHGTLLEARRLSDGEHLQPVGRQAGATP
jgi:hypothetical protein